MTEPLRRVERWDAATQAWVVVPLQALHNGDRFRLWEATGERVVDKDGSDTFMVEGEPYERPWGETGELRITVNSHAVPA